MKKFYAGIAIFALITITSCSKQEPLPAGTIESSTGIDVILEWSVNGLTTTETLSAVDIDLTLNSASGTTVASSTSGGSFEDVSLESFYADGSYDLDVEYYSGSSAVNYTLYFRPTGGTIEETITGSFNSDESGVTETGATITKSGNRYTIQ